MSAAIPDIYCFGYISGTFGPWKAQQYLGHLLKTDYSTLRPYIFFSENRFMVLRNLLPEEHVSRGVLEDPVTLLVVLDHARDTATGGPVIPQRLFRSSSEATFIRNVIDAH